MSRRTFPLWRRLLVADMVEDLRDAREAELAHARWVAAGKPPGRPFFEVERKYVYNLVCLQPWRHGVLAPGTET